jgi:tight adherence protein C
MFLTLVCASLGGIVGCVVGSFESLAWVLPGALLGGAILPIRMQSLVAARFLEAGRELPALIDLAALSMSAGSDLPAAVRRVIAGRSGVVAEELGYFLRSLELGITRQAALFSLRDRLPVQEVRDLVRAIMMAERKGTSISDALSQQARSGRQKRSIRAEEAAARAGVLLLVPIMLLMGCVVVLIMGPLMLSQSAF